MNVRIASTDLNRCAVAVAACCAAVALAGCGKTEAQASAAPQPKAAVAATPHPTAAATLDNSSSADEVARLARADLKCPAQPATPARAAAAPVDDVMGVRPGLGYDDAKAAVLCTDALLVASDSRRRGFELKAAQAANVRQGFEVRSAEPRVVKTSKQIMKEMQDEAMARGSNRVREDLKPGQVKWFVGTMGAPGTEQVLSVAREQRFAADATPTIDNVIEALLKKYGTPTQQQKGATPLLRWAYDPRGRLITETSPLYTRCHGASSPDAGVNLTPDCGIVVQAMLIAPRDNPALVERLQVGVVDQAGGYRLITATEQALRQADEQRRAQQVRDAAKNSKVPTL